MLALLLLVAVQVAPPDPAGVPPPPPLLVEDPVDPADPSASPNPAPTPTPPPPPHPVDVSADAGPAVVHHRTAWLPRPLLGGVAAAAGAGLGAAAGASFLFWGSITPGTPSVVLLLGAVATPALAAFLAGSAFVAFAIERPSLDDWGLVAGCTAVGCLALGLIVLGGGTGLGSIGTGCDVPSSCCGGSPAAPTRSGSGDEGVIWATASGGLGAAVGLGVGGLVGLAMVESQPGAAAVPLLATSAGAGMLVGALVGGAIGGAAAGARDDDSVAREAARRPAPARADRPR